MGSVNTGAELPAAPLRRPSYHARGSGRYEHACVLLSSENAKVRKEARMTLFVGGLRSHNPGICGTMCDGLKPSHEG